MPDIQIVPGTSYDEINDIAARYTNPTELQDAIINNTLPDDIDLNDAIVAYTMMTGLLLDPVVNHAAYLADTSTYSHLWSTEAMAAYTSLGDLFPHLMPAVENFATLADAVDGRDGNLRRDLEGYFRDNQEEIFGDTDEYFIDLFSNPQEAVTLFLQLGSPWLALLFFSAYVSAPTVREIQEEIFFQMEEINYTIDDEMMWIAGLDSEYGPDQNEIRLAEQRIQQLRTTYEAFTQILQITEDILNTEIDAASGMENSASRLWQSIVGRMS